MLKKEEIVELTKEGEAYRQGFKDGYNAGFTDGKGIHNNIDERVEVG